MANELLFFMEVVVGVLRFNFESCNYAHVMADPLYIDKDFDASSFSISVNGLPDGDGVLVAVARVAFYQQVNGGLFLLSGAAGFGVAMFGCCDV